jgi:hypothetical protein
MEALIKVKCFTINNKIHNQMNCSAARANAQVLARKLVSLPDTTDDKCTINHSYALS